MGSQPDYLRKKFAPLRDKTLKNALAHRIGQEFPGMGGYRIRHVCAEMVLEVLDAHIRPAGTLRHGQVFWTAIDVNARPRQYQRIADASLVPVILDLSTAEDIDLRLARALPGRRLQHRAVRLCRQAYEQGGLLSNCDLAELLNTNDSRIAQVLADYERTNQLVVPRRATIHDVGTGLTHKRIICIKRYAEGKEADQVARETYHSLEAVDRYLGQYDRVRHCRLHGMTAQETATALNCSVALVQEYLAIDDELETKDA
jgi:hypothetical protein